MRVAIEARKRGGSGVGLGPEKENVGKKKEETGKKSKKTRKKERGGKERGGLVIWFGFRPVENLVWLRGLEDLVWI